MQKPERMLRKAGLIGGMSWETTAMYYRLLQKQTQQTFGSGVSLPCLIDSLPFHEVTTYQHDGDWDAVGRMLADSAVRLEQSGARFIGILSNTVHLRIRDVEQAVSIPVMSITEAAAAAVSASRILVLGTSFTVDHRLYDQALRDRGIEPIYLPAPLQQDLHKKIFSELTSGIVTADTEALVERCARHGRDAGCTSMLLGCTELELAAKSDILPFVSTVQAHVDRLFQEAVSGV
ncbi:aspartate/glutamate racemase family protein [Alkalicoccus luteus]|uniref:aspartate/glutamate racemase family protein n=1 Tax=Alkalicoccus luteus TaxID=1237094 RepID=UPI004034F591